MKPYASTSNHLASSAVNEISVQSAEYRRLHELRVKNLTGMAQQHERKVQTLEQHLASYGKLRRTYPKGTTGSQQAVLKRLANEKKLHQLALSGVERARQDLEVSVRHEAVLLEKKSTAHSTRLELDASSSAEQRSIASPTQKVEALLQGHGYGISSKLPSEQRQRVSQMRNEDDYLSAVAQALNKLRNRTSPRQDV